MAILELMIRNLHLYSTKSVIHNLKSERGHLPQPVPDSGTVAGLRPDEYCKTPPFSYAMEGSEKTLP